MTVKERQRLGANLARALELTGESDSSLSRALKEKGLKPNSRTHIANVRTGRAGAQGRAWWEATAEVLGVRLEFLTGEDSEDPFPPERRAPEGVPREEYNELSWAVLKACNEVYMPEVVQEPFTAAAKQIAMARPWRFGKNDFREVDAEAVGEWLEDYVPQRLRTRRTWYADSRDIAAWLSAAAVMYLNETRTTHQEEQTDG